MNIKKFTSIGSRHAALTWDGKVLSWGYSVTFSTVSASLSANVVELYNTEYAFAAVKNDNTVVTWGDEDYGGDSSTVTSTFTNGQTVENIYGNGYVFAAVLAAPTPEPTPSPTPAPSLSPTQYPTPSPTNEPTNQPTNDPTKDPTYLPTSFPSPSPSAEPTRFPSTQPTYMPSTEPTPAPTREPTQRSTQRPTQQPTLRPSVAPTQEPTSANGGIVGPGGGGTNTGLGPGRSNSDGGDKGDSGGENAVNIIIGIVVGLIFCCGGAASAIYYVNFQRGGSQRFGPIRNKMAAEGYGVPLLELESDNRYSNEISTISLQLSDNINIVDKLLAQASSEWLGTLRNFNFKVFYYTFD